MPDPPLPAVVDADACEDAGEVGDVAKGSIARLLLSVVIVEIEDRCRVERLCEIGVLGRYREQ